MEFLFKVVDCGWNLKKERGFCENWLELLFTAELIF
jgi:hypothetical protein